MKERIQKFIDYKNITPGDLAEILGVQRSNISHILNGRNKPGAIFIEKFLLAFPRVNARWLFTGEGPMVLGDTEPDTLVKEQQQELKSEPDIPYARKSKPPVSIPPPAEKEKETDRVLEKVVLLYSDGTFIPYDPV